MTCGRRSLKLGTAVSCAHSFQLAESLWPPPSEISLEEDAQKVQHSGFLMSPRPRTRDYSPWGSKCVPAWGVWRGARGVAAAEPLPDGQRCGKRRRTLPTPQGGFLAAAGFNPAPRPVDFGSSTVGAPRRVHGSWTWAGWALIALGKVGQRVPSARPSSSERSLLHALQL